MKEWFTVEPISDDTWAISEYRHREHTHCYLLTGQSRALLIDTGLGVCDLGEVIRTLTDLPIQVVTTHAHWDHIGSHGSFCSIAVHIAEREWLAGQFPLPIETVRRSLYDPECVFPVGFNWQEYSLYTQGASSFLADGGQFDLGGRIVEILHTPGHSPGHCCFWEAERGWLWSGDLIYAGKLDAFYPSTDPTQFAASVRKMSQLPVKKLLPGHHHLNLSPNLIDHVRDAFDALEHQGLLHHGSGVHLYDGFSIHL